MKLFVIASVIAVAAAARLEHLERGYLPPFGGQADALGSGPKDLGPNGLGPNGFDLNGGSGVNARRPLGQAGSFGAATSNQYLPPNQGPSAGITGQGNNQFRTYQQDVKNPFDTQPGQAGFGAQPGFGNQPNLGLQSPFGNQPNSQYGTPQFGASSNFLPDSSFGFGINRPSAQYQPSQYSATDRRYLAPKSGPSSQSIPQQDFDEETGYHY